MIKRKTIKTQIAVLSAKKIREWKREMAAEVCKKGRVETVGDICAVFYGLSRKAVECAAYGRIQYLAARGYSPAEIIERMEVKK